MDAKDAAFGIVNGAALVSTLDTPLFLATIVGGNITLLSDLCERTRDDAFKKMTTHAMMLGANAIIGVRYDATEVMQGVTEVLCYGTAVVVEKQ